MKEEINHIDTLPTNVACSKPGLQNTGWVHFADLTSRLDFLKFADLSDNFDTTSQGTSALPPEKIISFQK